MSWYIEVLKNNTYIEELASDAAYDEANSMYPLDEYYEFEDGDIIVERWDSVDCCGYYVPIPKKARVRLSEDSLEEIARQAGFEEGDWFWENVIENWKSEDLQTEFTMRLSGCDLVPEYDRYVDDSWRGYESSVSGWIDYIRDNYFYGQEEEFDEWLREEGNSKKVRDFVCSFDGWFESLCEKLADHISDHMHCYKDSLEQHLLWGSIQKVADDLADKFAVRFVKTCAEIYGKYNSIPPAVFVLVRDEIWEEFLKSELGLEVSNESLEHLEAIKERYYEVLVTDYSFPEDLINLVDASVAMRR